MKYLVTFMLFFFVSCKSVYIPDNELIIKTLSYKDDDKLPSPEENCFVRIDLLKPDNYQVIKPIFCDTLRSSELKLTPDNNMLHFGHQGIKATKGKKTSITEIIYKGGSIQINLIIK